jgi:hypothetical protein
LKKVREEQQKTKKEKTKKQLMLSSHTLHAGGSYVQRLQT